MWHKVQDTQPRKIDQASEKNSSNMSEREWDLEIAPRTSLLKLNLGEAWRYRDLVLLFVRRDFVAQYTQTVLGPIWHIVQPALTTIMFLFVFGRIAKIPTDGIHPVLFFMSGVTVWNYFSFSLSATSNTFVTNASIFGKVYFPRIVLPISVVISNMVRFGIQFSLLLAVMAWLWLTGEVISITWYWLLIPLLVIAMAIIAIGLGIIISSVTTKYRDFQVLMTFAVQLFMYATPIVYPMSYLGQTKYAKLISLNPLSPLIEAFRFCLFGQGTVTLAGLLYSLIFAIVLFFVGLIFFTKVEKSFMDTV
jgi:lipopolysaccharide transport system permease protein